jgi:hypothetical protein
VQKLQPGITAAQETLIHFKMKTILTILLFISLTGYGQRSFFGSTGKLIPNAQSDTSSELGSLLTENFSGTSLNSRWTYIHGSEASNYTVNNKLTTDGEEDFHWDGRYLELDDSLNDGVQWLPYNQFEVTVKFAAPSKTSTSFGLGFSTGAVPELSGNNTEMFFKCDLSTGNSSAPSNGSGVISGTMGFVYAADYPVVFSSLSPLSKTLTSWSSGDSMWLIMQQKADSLNFILINRTQNHSDTLHIPGGTTGTKGKLRMNFFGDQLQVASVAISSHCKLYKPLFVGDSQTVGSGASDTHHRWEDLVYSSDYKKFNVGAAGSTKILQLLKWQRELLKLHPTYVINFMGFNDNISSDGNFSKDYDTVTVRFQRAVGNNAKVINMAFLPNPAAYGLNSTIHTISTNRGAGFVDYSGANTCTSLEADEGTANPIGNTTGCAYCLRPSYASADGYHANDAANVVIKTTLITAHPEIQ